MSDYDLLATFYDTYTDGFDYKDYLDFIFEKVPFLPSCGLALDCGCGTGSLICELISRGYSCTGVDAAPEMLARAREKLEAVGSEPHLVCQPLEHLDLYGAYHLCFCTLDTVNHITSKRSLERFFTRLYDFTEPGGYFIFDVKTRKTFGTSSVNVYERGEDLLITDVSVRKDAVTNVINVFTERDGMYERTDAVIKERFYDDTYLKKILAGARFKFVKKVAYRGRIIYIYEKESVCVPSHPCV